MPLDPLGVRVAEKVVSDANKATESCRSALFCASKLTILLPASRHSLVASTVVTVWLSTVSTPAALKSVKVKLPLALCVLLSLVCAGSSVKPPATFALTKSRWSRWMAWWRRIEAADAKVSSGASLVPMTVTVTFRVAVLPPLSMSVTVKVSVWVWPMVSAAAACGLTS